MPRARDNSRGATERECLANIERARTEAAKADTPAQLTTLAKAFYEARKRLKR